MVALVTDRAVVDLPLADLAGVLIVEVGLAREVGLNLNHRHQDLPPIPIHTLLTLPSHTPGQSLISQGPAPDQNPNHFLDQLLDLMMVVISLLMVVLHLAEKVYHSSSICRW